jgi:alpha-L-arabinofuranosidase
LALVWVAAARLSAAETGGAITIDATQPRTKVSPSLYGIFFEEINHAGEGGLYAEMVQNRDFEINTLPAGASWAGNLLRTTNGWQERKWFGSELQGWSLIKKGLAAGSIPQDDQSPLNDRNPHSLRLVVKAVGHPAPFPLRYIEIGNEAGGPIYGDNYRQFYEAIHAKYPSLTIISNQRFRDAPVEMVDDHKYGDPAAFFGAFQQYDAADRRGPKVYVGEFACNGGVREGNLMAALSEAAYRLGLERNSDVVRMSSYAPLFFHVNDIQWPVNMIGFDSSRVALRTSYYVQKMLAWNRPDEILQTQVAPASNPKDAEVFATAGLARKTGDVLVRVVNRAAAPRTMKIHIQGVAGIGSRARVTTLSHDDPTAENTVDFPDAVLPVESTFDGAGAEFTYVFRPYSFTLLRLASEKPL